MTKRTNPDAINSRGENEQAADSLIQSYTDDVLHLTLNRPKTSNALTPELVESLIDALAQHAQARLCVIRGEGRNFCAGFDLSDLAELSDGDLLLRLVRIETLLQRIHHAPFPVVAQAQGHVVGAGADIFAACWQRIAAPGAKFKMPGWQFELALGTRRLARLIGPDAARHLLIDTHTLDTDAAHGAGLVSRVAAPDEWTSITEQLLERARILPANALSGMLNLTVVDSRSADMAALVLSASAPGLKLRILDYKERLRLAREVAR